MRIAYVERIIRGAEMVDETILALIISAAGGIVVVVAYHVEHGDGAAGCVRKVAEFAADFVGHAHIVPELVAKGYAYHLSRRTAVPHRDSSSKCGNRSLDVGHCRIESGQVRRILHVGIGQGQYRKTGGSSSLAGSQGKILADQSRRRNGDGVKESRTSVGSDGNFVCGRDGHVHGPGGSICRNLIQTLGIGGYA